MSDKGRREISKLARLRAHSESLREFARSPIEKQRADDMLWLLDLYDARQAEEASK